MTDSRHFGFTCLSFKETFFELVKKRTLRDNYNIQQPTLRLVYRCLGRLSTTSWCSFYRRCMFLRRTHTSIYKSYNTEYHTAV